MQQRNKLIVGFTTIVLGGTLASALSSPPRAMRTAVGTASN